MTLKKTMAWVCVVLAAAVFGFLSNECQAAAEAALLEQLPQRMSPIKIAGAEADVFVLSPTDKIISTQNLAELPGLQPAESISIELAKNESEDILLAVRSSRDLSGVSLRFTAMQGKGGVLDAGAWRWQKVMEVECEHPTRWYGIWCSYTGLIGDPLVPGEAFDLSAGKNQALLVNVSAPGVLAAGVYSGVIELLEQQNVLMSLPVALEVWDLTLPPNRRCKTIAPMYGQGKFGAETLKSLGVTNPKYGAEGLTWSYDDETGELTIDTTKYEASVHLWLDEMKFETICLPPELLGTGSKVKNSYLGTGIAVGSEGFWPIFDQFMTKMGDFYRAHGWQDRVVWYMMDEINEEHYPIAAQLARRAKSLFPELQVMLVCNNVPDYLADSIDIWVIPWHFFVTREEDVAEWQRLHNRGLRLASYMNSLYYINADWSLSALRLFPSVLAKYQHEGGLWWGLSSYGPGDPWKNATTSTYNAEKKLYSMANGYLIYPPRENDPAYRSSLRWESYRQGFDEFEMLEMLRDRYRETLLTLAGVEPQETVAALFDVDTAIKHWGDSLGSSFRVQTYRRDAGYIYRFRQLLAQELMAIASEPLGLADVDVSGYVCLNDSLRVYGICQAGAHVEVNGQPQDAFSSDKAFFFETNVSLTPGANLITICFTDDAGQAKVLYREVTHQTK